ncbi:MAG: sigma-70 family RNA polymerase sigma factor [Microgenomates group bacterium]
MEDLYQKYYKGVRGFVARKIDDEGTAEEITNDVLLAAIESMPSFNGKCSEFSFVCSIAKHKIIDYYRKKKLKTVLFSTSPIFEEIADKALNPERDVLKNELKAEIEKTMKEMKEGYSKLLRLKYVDGWRIAKIAQMTATTVKSVESKLIRAKREFQSRWIYDRKKAKEFVKTGNTD